MPTKKKSSKAEPKKKKSAAKAPPGPRTASTDEATVNVFGSFMTVPEMAETYTHIGLFIKLQGLVAMDEETRAQKIAQLNAFIAAMEVPANLLLIGGGSGGGNGDSGNNGGEH